MIENPRRFDFCTHHLLSDYQIKEHPCKIEVINNHVYITEDILGIVALGPYPPETEEDWHLDEDYLEDVEAIIEIYGQADDSILSRDAQELKKRINEYITVTEEPIPWDDEEDKE